MISFFISFLIQPHYDGIFVENLLITLSKKWFMYSGVFAYKYSGVFAYKVGVRQGCTVSPFLSTFFINELDTEYYTQILFKYFCWWWLMMSSTIPRLQNQLNVLEQFYARSCLNVNKEKTKVGVLSTIWEISLDRQGIGCTKKL